MLKGRPADNSRRRFVSSASLCTCIAELGFVQGNFVGVLGLGAVLFLPLPFLWTFMS